MIWNQYFKLDEQGNRCMAQQTYEPLVSEDGKTFCKNYDQDNEYQKLTGYPRPLYTREVVDWFFNNEIKWLEFFKNKPYAPEVVDIDLKNKKIYIKWYNETCNQIMYGGKFWPKDIWKQQIKDIITDQYQDGVYKLTMYPHCHYIDDQNNMRAIDWYGCVPVSDPFVEAVYMDGIIHETAKFRLDETGDQIDHRYNLEIMFKNSLRSHVLWGEENMSFIYKDLFNA